MSQRSQYIKLRVNGKKDPNGFKRAYRNCIYFICGHGDEVTFYLLNYREVARMDRYFAAIRTGPKLAQA